ncbi:RimK family alpha-L-glutamate ligase [Mesorhizobium sp. J18]|uniref:ATP-grasp domain-containing protein n=1 Tax=Mesorhizobium sp. J18 TaxID=935263 RepID=UPI00119A8755|nr:RimK family alpha-L-glutamate ligase [Mesorhizobium sp. J18]TWG99486.1 RimK family alpha-L-glutamate ligase [Mesorhizobium sp. J18]
MTRRIVILNSQPGNQGGALAAAFRRRGCEVSTYPLADIVFDTQQQSGLYFPGFGDDLPDAVLVRSVGAGTFEAVTRRLGVLHALRKLSVPVWNSAQAIERCVDKSMTTFLLKRAGLTTPPTFAVEGFPAAQEIAARELASTPLVLKPLFGSQGRGIRLVRSLADLPSPEEVDDTYYLQHYVPRSGPPFCDYRIFVCAGRIVDMMIRRGDNWITNIQKGAVPEIVPPEMRQRLGEMALAAAAAVEADFAGIDILPAMDGSLQVVEVNSMPAWSGLQTVAQADIADTIAEEMMRFLDERARLASLSLMPSSGEVSAVS